MDFSTKTNPRNCSSCCFSLRIEKRISKSGPRKLLGRFCKLNPLRFSERSASRFWLPIHMNMCGPKVCSAKIKWIFCFIFRSASSDGDAAGDVKKILAETLLLSNHKVTKWPWRGRTSVFPWFALQSSAGRS